eukprot:TRINITY_DN46022_c0_g1_i1.p1 TRINITY_DN46022_c0_g1~~TRINITY_DN46022_c0_g1_i1.p1  ORF type:complete len:193 (+),score=30.05 TRINITY_DN46022_c0_g1_i1:190-768(+)
MAGWHDRSVAVQLLAEVDEPLLLVTPELSNSSQLARGHGFVSALSHMSMHSDTALGAVPLPPCHGEHRVNLVAPRPTNSDPTDRGNAERLALETSLCARAYMAAREVCAGHLLADEALEEATSLCRQHRAMKAHGLEHEGGVGTKCWMLSLIHISEPTRLLSISYAVFCLKKKKKQEEEVRTGIIKNKKKER